jgi:hypothetical protein
MDRLLTQDEFEKAEDDGEWKDDYNPILKAQLVKTDKEWVEWIKKISHKRAFPQNKESADFNSNAEFYCISSKDLQERKRCIALDWQRFKREVGQ